MKCPKCGAESTGKFCPECGCELEQAASDSIKIDNNEDTSTESIDSSNCGTENKGPANNMDNNKIPFYLSGWFIFVIAYIGAGFTCGLSYIAGIVLACIRKSKYKEKKVNNNLILGGLIAPAAIIVIFFIVAIIASSNEEKQIETFITSGQYKEAESYIEDKYGKGSNSYIKNMLKIYEAQDDYDGAALFILDEIADDEPLKIKSDYIEKLKEYVNHTSEDVTEKINSKLEDIKKAEEERAKEEAEKKAADEKAAKEAKEAEKKAKQEAAEKEAAEKEAKIESERINLNEQLEFEAYDYLVFEGVIYTGYSKGLVLSVPCLMANTTDDNFIGVQTLHITGDNKESKDAIEEICSNKYNVGKTIKVKGKAEYDSSTVSGFVIETTSVSKPEERNLWKDLYVQYSKEYEYDDLRRNVNEGAAIKQTITINSVEDDYLIAYDGDFNYFFINNTTINETPIFDGDKITIYGRYDGLNKSQNGKMIPCIYAFTFDFVK